MNGNSQNSRAKITIRQVAEAAGVSMSTVSRAMRNDPKAKKGTRDRIIQIAKDLNYYPDSLAMALRQKKTNTIGIIFNDLNNPFYTEILSAIGKVLNQTTYSLLISYSHYDHDQERENIISMLSRRVDGIIMSPIDDKSDNIKLLQQNKDHVEFVLIDCFPSFDDIGYVYSEHGRGAALATEYLISRGHQNVLLMTGPPERCMVEHFVNGYESTLKKHNIPVQKGFIVDAEDLTIDAGYRTFKHLLTGVEGPSLPDFTAVVTISDMLAIGIYKVANELGFRIPDDYSIIGYDDIELAGVLTPPLTTIHQPRKRIGTGSLEMLIRNIEHEDQEREVLAFLPHLVKRGSVRATNFRPVEP